MYIYTAHNRKQALMRCNTLILVEEECLQWLSECGLSAVGVSELVWKQVPDSGSGDWRLRMPDGRVCYVDGVVHSASYDVRNVVADYWRCLRLERSSLPDTTALCCGDIDALSHRACTGPDLLHRASASRHVESVTVHHHTCACRLRDVRRRSAN